MRRYIELGPGPAHEPCAQLGSDDYYERMELETSRYIKLLKRMFPNRPDGCSFRRMSHSHDFGTYHEVVVTYDDDVKEEIDFAFSVEGKLPARWPECEHKPIKITYTEIGVTFSHTCSDCGKPFTY